VSVVTDHHRYQTRNKREAAHVVPIDELRAETIADTAAEFEMSAVLSWIDVERLVEAESDRKNAARNVLIFKLHYIDGLSQAEIAQYPGFNLVEAGVEAVLGRLRARLRKGIQTNDTDDRT
jgi:DNA-directed RNA polymerase specialized sigma24 family protein